MAIWTIKNSKADIKGMAKYFNISEIFATVLANRKLTSIDNLNMYLNPQLSNLNNLIKMNGVREAFDILNNAILQNKKICIYGDYDVDGVSSTVILYKSIRNLTNNIFYYIPDREIEGYGLNLSAINTLKEIGADLIFTCDNGIASIEEVNVIKNLGMQIIILDHHEPRFEEDRDGKRHHIIPNADALIDPKVEKCQYPFKYLCAGGLAYRFVKEFYKFINKDLNNEDELLVFASIATICDIVDLIGENRIIAKEGIKILNKNRNINLGLYKIMLFQNILDKPIDEVTYGFSIGPCINASGRLESALKAVKLFVSQNEEEINEIAQELVSLNEKRKELTKAAVEKIINKIENSDISNDKVFIIYDEKIHESIAGIVAGRIKEIYFKPTIIITKGKDICKGSGRSIPNYNIFDAILEVRNLFTKFGGHPMAIGFSIPKENIHKLREALNKNISLSTEDMTEIISIDKNLNFSQINIDLAKEILHMKPNGKENKKPIFATKNVSFLKINFIGKDKNLLKLDIIDESKTILKGISFNLYRKFKDIIGEIDLEDKNKKNIDLKFDIVYYIEVNNYNGNKNLQLNLQDLRISK